MIFRNLAAAFVGSISFAEFLPVLNIFLHLHIPPVILESLQGFAWLAGGIAACITIIVYIEKRFVKWKTEKKWKKKKN